MLENLLGQAMDCMEKLVFLMFRVKYCKAFQRQVKIMANEKIRDLKSRYLNAKIAIQEALARNILNVLVTIMKHGLIEAYLMVELSRNT